jgi:hypothetical protein
MSKGKVSGSRTTSTDLSLSMCQSQQDFPSLNKIYQHTTVAPVLTKTRIVIPNKPRQWVQTFCETRQSTFQVAGLSIHTPLGSCDIICGAEEDVTQIYVQSQ